MIWMLIKGIILGFSIAAPVGPIGVLCIRRTLASGRAVGLVTGLGAASADAVYGAIAGFGLTYIAHFLVSQEAGLRWVGGGFLLYLGIKIFLSKARTVTPETDFNGLVSAYVSTFFLTLTNPMTILSFTALFAGIGLANRPGDYGTATMLVLGVFIGSALWWLILSRSVGGFRFLFNENGLQWVNRIAGVVVTGFAFIALWGLI